MDYWMMKNLFSFMISTVPEISIFHTGSIQILILDNMQDDEFISIIKEW